MLDWDKIISLIDKTEIPHLVTNQETGKTYVILGIKEYEKLLNIRDSVIKKGVDQEVDVDLQKTYIPPDSAEEISGSPEIPESNVDDKFYVEPLE